MPRCVRISLLPLMVFFFASAAPALTITIGASDSGWFNDAGDHTANNENYSAGWTGNFQFRNFFVFDVTGLPGGETILSATLRAFNPEDGVPTAAWTDGYDSPDASETYDLYDVTLLTAGPASDQIGNTLVYDDLGSGTLFGSVSASSADNGEFIEVGLNSDGRTALGSAVGNFVIGGLITSLTETDGVEELVWGNTHPPGQSPATRELVVVLTPEPGTGLLLGLGLLGWNLSRRIGARRNG